MPASLWISFGLDPLGTRGGGSNQEWDAILYSGSGDQDSYPVLTRGSNWLRWGTPSPPVRTLSVDRAQSAESTQRPAPAVNLPANRSLFLRLSSIDCTLPCVSWQMGQ